ncbi:TetR/AcrR family transcriptional regulator [Antrihabitans sp. YC3-6]|uniref:TetR/AcrR family transcriptional regulator n=1 Tax=Antrihabitans stalagmiti TaxID=2799499 RepID=A0A934NT80_9NOCA|nr:TetR/AcrR family transcriptional regulator [Antrihabitans stalagmiti]MBJ8340792.1 TetR/AcrR family transcriptional regulator [Antrihabitans stalagmiti]
MARQQERARRTRAAIIGSAAVEFGKSGYAAASLNRILEGSHATKGAMYFHFDSKEDLARAVMESALERYRATTSRWMLRAELDPYEILHGMNDEIAMRFEADVIVQAEFRLIIEPEFYGEIEASGGTVLGKAANELATRAEKAGQLRADADPAKFTRVLSAALAGQRYLADLLAEQAQIRPRFEEALEVVLEAMATPEWLAKWRAVGWQTSASPEDLKLEA